jgi:phage replication initiation protein
MKKILVNVERSTEITSGSLNSFKEAKAASFKSLTSQNSRTKSRIVMPEKSQVFIDYLTLSISDISDHATYFMWIDQQLQSIGLIISKRQSKIPIGYDIGYLICSNTGSNFVCGSIKYSHKYCRVLLQLTGNGCAMAELNDSFKWIESLVMQDNVKLKRVDLAVDDYQGKFCIEKVDKAYSRGAFNGSTGRRPVKRNLGDKHNGRTRYIGGQTAYKQVCIYEKGKKEGLQESDLWNWVRAEVRFNSNGRDTIPKEIFKFKSDYFYSAYPKAFSSLIHDAQLRSVVYRINLEFAANLGRSARNSRRQYGKINHELMKVFGNEIAMELITRPGKSEKLQRHPLVNDQYLRKEFEGLVTTTAKHTPLL